MIHIQGGETTSPPCFLLRSQRVRAMASQQRSQTWLHSSEPNTDDTQCSFCDAECKAERGNTSDLRKHKTAPCLIAWKPRPPQLTLAQASACQPLSHWLLLKCSKKVHLCYYREINIKFKCGRDQVLICNNGLLYLSFNYQTSCWWLTRDFPETVYQIQLFHSVDMREVLRICSVSADRNSML